MKPGRTATTKPPRPQQRSSGRRARADQARLEENKRRRLVAAMSVGALAALLGLGLVAFRSGGSGARGVSDPARFDLPALEGNGRVRLADFRGKPLVVNMFASWCKVCTDELPGFTSVAHEVSGQVRFIGLDSQETGDGAAMAGQFHLRDAGFTLAKDIGASPASGLHDAIGAQGMPATLFYDAQGHLVDKVLQGMSRASLREKLAQLYGIG
ncbi:MAG: hypothetical protein NVS3B12_05000 [Acidimicrobiales bacterium]